MFFLSVSIALAVQFGSASVVVEPTPIKPVPKVETSKTPDGQFECVLSLESRKVWRVVLPQRPEFIGVHKASYIGFGWYDLPKSISPQEGSEHWIVAFSVDSDGIVNELWRVKRSQWVGSTSYPLVEAAAIDTDEIMGLLMVRDGPGSPLLIKRFSLASLLPMPDITVVDDRLKTSQLLGAKCLDKSPLIALVWWVGGTRNVLEKKGASELVQIIDGTSGKLAWEKYIEGAWGLENPGKLSASWTDVKPLIQQDGDKVLIRRDAGQSAKPSETELIRVTTKDGQVIEEAKGR